MSLIRDAPLDIREVGGGKGGEKYEVKFVAAKVGKKIVDGIH